MIINSDVVECIVTVRKAKIEFDEEYFSLNSDIFLMLPLSKMILGEMVTLRFLMSFTFLFVIILILTNKVNF